MADYKRKTVPVGCFILLFLAVMWIWNPIVAAANEVYLSTTELVLYPGESYILESTIVSEDADATVEYSLYQKKKQKKLAKSKYLNLDPVTGEIVALKPGSVTVCAESVTWNNVTADWETARAFCKVTVMEDMIDSGLNYDSIVRAVGSKRVKLLPTQAEEGSTVTYASSNKAVAKVGKKGRIRPIGAGKARITVTVAKDGEETVYGCDVEVTAPVLKKETLVVEKGSSSEAVIEGISDNSVIQWAVEDSSIAVISLDGTVYGKKEGSTTVIAKVDGLEQVFIVYVTDSSVATPVVSMIVGDSRVLVPENVEEGQVVNWTSEHPEIVSVAQDGTVTALAKGNTVISASFGEQTVSYHVSSGENRKALEAVEAGLSLLGCKYSTSKRMEEGYYDCSSYVFRIFAPLGYLFGCESETENAPVAADLAKWCEENQYVLAKEPVYDLDLLLPGDLIFYSYGGNNGRFMNIDHVAIYSGYGSIIHASDETTGVKKGNYWVDHYIVMVARPAA